MEENVLGVLATRRARLRSEWERRLRAQRMSSPLANPDALVYLMDWTLDGIFAVLSEPDGRVELRRREVHCDCGLNPLLAYFAIAEVVLIEALQREQSRYRADFPGQHESELVRLKQAVSTVANREIEAFCAVCQHRGAARAPQDEAVGCSRSR